MERVISDRQLKHGVIIIVKDSDGNEIVGFGGEIIGFPFARHSPAGSGPPDTILVRLSNKRERDVPFSELGLGPHAKAERRTYIVE